MAKYYIQSGEIKFVVTAADADGAALWVVNKTIDDVLPTALDQQTLTDDDFICVATEGLDRLEPEMHVSEIGFGRHEVAVFDTELLFKHWYQLRNAMNYLFDQM